MYLWTASLSMTIPELRIESKCYVEESSRRTMTRVQCLYSRSCNGMIVCEISSPSDHDLGPCNDLNCESTGIGTKTRLCEGA